MENYITKEQLESVKTELEKATDYIEYRKTFFSAFKLSDRVPENLIDSVYQIALRFYDDSGLGYYGVMAEIRDRIDLYSMIDGFVEIREFLLHKADKTDFYDKENKVAYEKKTGCGSWLYSEKNYLLSDIIEEYKRKKRLLRWDYDFVPDNDRMTQGKTLQWNDKQTGRKDGKKSQKQYEIHIHCELSYKKFFEHLEKYPSGVETFFKESVRSGQAGTYIYDLQTIKNSKKKIEFLEQLNNL